MNRAELLTAVSVATDISKAAAGRVLDEVLASIKTALIHGCQVTIVGFGNFYVAHRLARTGHDLQTGATIKIKSAKVPRFRSGLALKNAINAPSLVARATPLRVSIVGDKVKLNKSDLLDQVSRGSKVPKETASLALDKIVDVIKAALRKGDSVTLTGFGTFHVTRHMARSGRNPRTGAPI